jgi:hypothetical protein
MQPSISLGIFVLFEILKIKIIIFLFFYNLNATKVDLAENEPDL